MPVANPRADARSLIPVPTDWTETEEHMRIVSRAIRQLQQRDQRVDVTSVSATYSMVDMDGMILADATNTGITVFLLSAAGREGRLVEVKKIDSSANVVLLDASGAETMDGSTTISLSAQYSMRGLRSDGANWHVVSQI